MEEALLPENEEKQKTPIWNVFVEELKNTSYIALPMVIVTVSQQLSRVVSMMMVGHLGELELSGAAIATAVTNVLGFSVLFGMSSALETLCGQAYGAEQYHKLGAYTGCAVLSLIVVCIPISFLFLFLDELLEFIGQDPQISREAGRYAVCLIPTLFPYAILQLLIRYLQAQSLIMPMLLSSIAALLFHVPVCWVLVYKFDSGAAGAALAIGLSYWLNVISLGVYVKCSSGCRETRISFSRFDFSSIKEFFRFAIPSALMVCLEWWSCEIIVLLSGILPNPKLESSVLSICMLTASLHYFIPFSIGAAASTRVSNELGAGNSKRAKVAVWAVSFLAVMEVLIATTVLICCRNILGFAFSNDKEVVSYIKDIIPLVCLSLSMDGIQAVLSGVARGCGWQHLGAYVNLSSYYMVGIPVAVLLGFGLHFGGTGLWMGINAGSIVQVTLLSIVTSRTNWHKQASIVRERIFEDRSSAEKGSEIHIDK